MGTQSTTSDASGESRIPPKAPVLRRDKASTTLELQMRTRWSEQLMSALELIHLLGICTAFTSKPEFAAMEITDVDLKHKSLIANLIDQSNQGYVAFSAAHRDLQQIADGTYYIGITGGLLDKIVERFGEPGSSRSITRDLETLDEEVNEVSSQAKSIENAFRTWGESTLKLQLAVGDKLASASKEVEQNNKATEKSKRAVIASEEEVKIANEKKDSTRSSLSEAKNDMKEAAAIYTSDGHIGRQFGYITSGAFAGGALTGALAGLALGPVGLLVGAAAGAIGAAVHNAKDSSAIDKLLEKVQQAQKDFEESSKNLRNCRLQLMENRGSLNSAKSEEEKWADVRDAIRIALSELYKFQEHIREMVESFKSLVDWVRHVSQRCIKFTKIAASSDKLKADEIQEELQDLKESSEFIKAFSLLIHAYASMYSRISNDYIFGGFKLISQIGISDTNGMSLDEQIDRSNGKLIAFRKLAEPGIANIEMEVKLSLFEEVRHSYPNTPDPSTMDFGFSIRDHKIEVKSSEEASTGSV